MRSASQYVEGANLVEMIKEKLVAERIAIDHYRELIRHFGTDDPGTRIMIEGILVVEEEHANDMHDLLWRMRAAQCLSADGRAAPTKRLPDMRRFSGV